MPEQRRQVPVIAPATEHRMIDGFRRHWLLIRDEDTLLQGRSTSYDIGQRFGTII